MTTTTPASRVVIVGSGVFGLGTAIELARKGYKSVTVLDRALPPVADASSVDMSRIVRTDYKSPFYAALTSEAYERWMGDAVYRPAFYPTPVVGVVRNDPSDEADKLKVAYLDAILASLDKNGLAEHVDRHAEAEDCKRAFPALANGKLQEPFYGYVNRRGGWADAARGIAQVRDECARLGVSFITGAHGEVTRIEFEGGKAQAVRTRTGLRVEGDVFVFATGAWTASLLPLGGHTIQTAQVLASVRVSDEERRQLATLPIYMDSTRSFYSFPVHPDNGLLKIACHGWGYTYKHGAAGQAVTQAPDDPPTPVTPSSSNGGFVSTPPAGKPVLQKATFAPEETLAYLRESLALILGDEFVARHPIFDKTQLCWYTVTPTGDFIVDWHPGLAGDNVLVATGGSGHAYKMFPVLGKYVAQKLEGTLGAEASGKWAIDKELLTGGSKGSWGDTSLGGPPMREFEDWEKAEL